MKHLTDFLDSMNEGYFSSPRIFDGTIVAHHPRTFAFRTSRIRSVCSLLATMSPLGTQTKESTITYKAIIQDCKTRQSQYQSIP